MSPQRLQPNFGLIRLTVREQMPFEDFQDGRPDGHLRQRNGTILAVLNLSSSWFLPPSFDLIRLTVRGQITTEYFQDGRGGSNLGYRNKMILAILNVHVIPSNLRLGRRYRLKNFKMAIVWPSWKSERSDLAILNLHVFPMPPKHFRLNPTYRSGADVVWRVSRWRPW